MNTRMVFRGLFLVACAIFFVASSCVAADETVQALPAAKDLPEVCRKAKAEFRPLAQTDVEQSKKVLFEALGRLNYRLSQAGPNGEDWRKFLLWNELQEQLHGQKPSDKDVLIRVYQRYAAGHEGLELVWFLDVQQALRNYIATCNAIDNPQIRTAYEELLDKLADALERYAARPTTEDALTISESVRWLDDARQATTLIQAIETHYVQPNLMGEMSANIIGAGIAGPVDDTIAVRDCILGTDIYGTARTIGQTSVLLEPDANFGVFDTLFFGTTTSNNVGYNGPVTIYSSSTTNLSARKRLWIDADGLASYPGASKAVTNINICDIQSRRGRAMVERIAWKKAGKQQCKAEWIASRHAEQRLNERMDQQAKEAIEKANQTYTEKFQRPFTERKLFPQMVRFNTTSKAIMLTALQAGGGKVGAPTLPPPVAEDAEMSIRIHESMINNLCFDALAGRTVHEEKMQATVTDLLGHLPEKMKGDEDGKPWAISFAHRQPISVTFADDGFSVTLRGVKYYKGEEAHPGMNVSASYKIEKTDKGFKAVRQGEIEVLPPDFTPGKQIDARRQIIRKLLEKRFAKVFEPEILGEGLELPGKWKSAGKLLPIQVVCRDGWLVIGWKRAVTGKELAAAGGDPE